MNNKKPMSSQLFNTNITFCLQEKNEIGLKIKKNSYFNNFLKYVIVLFTCFTVSLNLNAQSKSNIIKFERILKTASTLNDFKSLIDGDGVSAICSLLGAGEICMLLSVEKLNVGEDEALAKIKSKYEFDKLLKSKGINPDDFYRELWNKKNSETLQDRFNFLDSNPQIRSMP